MSLRVAKHTYVKVDPVLPDIVQQAPTVSMEIDWASQIWIRQAMLCFVRDSLYDHLSMSTIGPQPYHLGGNRVLRWTLTLSTALISV